MSKELNTTVQELIALEREKQRGLGFDAAHDDARKQGELARAAAFFALPGTVDLSADGTVKLDPVYLLTAEFQDSCKMNRDSRSKIADPNSPEGLQEYRTLRIRELVKAGAFIHAEIERLQRAAKAQA